MLKLCSPKLLPILVATDKHYECKTPAVKHMLSPVGDPLTRRWVWFTKSHLVLVIFFLLMFYLVILFSIQNNGVLHPVEQLDHF